MHFNKFNADLMCLPRPSTLSITIGTYTVKINLLQTNSLYANLLGGVISTLFIAYC